MMTFAQTTIRRLLDSRNDEGVWVGQLSSSALSTATAIIALSCGNRTPELVARGRAWLERNQNPDGGWGDTVRSKSNISTTALCWAALPDGEAAAKAAAWLGDTNPEALSKVIAARYGKDQTFSVPILTALAIGGRLGSGPWKRVPQLPFELAAMPYQWFQWIQLPVVSYALPALIAIGLARHRQCPTRNPLARAVRNAAAGRVMRILQRIQPSCGGFLEATPLTSFVAMSLITAGLQSHEVVTKCLEFLCASIREDGSWPIDTNLSTWLTTLAINALGRDAFSEAERVHLTEWLLAQQFHEEHPYTHAAPGAWSWTNLPGAVPDADDTAGALLALRTLDVQSEAVKTAALQGIRWLLDLQNRDGGMPTFCRGWGHLPFDRSGPDLTAHALRAWNAWLPELPAADASRVRDAAAKAMAYLRATQQADGSWIPLWFGNQHAPGDQNKTFGTSRVVLALRDNAAGSRWLVEAQNPDGGWGGEKGIESTIEETSLALSTLAGTVHENAVQRGMAWLDAHTNHGEHFPSSPIGFYFASLWYFEDLYPLLFAAAAVRAAK